MLPVVGLVGLVVFHSGLDCLKAIFDSGYCQACRRNLGMYPIHNLWQVGRCDIVASRQLDLQMLGILNRFIEVSEHLRMGFHSYGFICL